MLPESPFPSVASHKHQIPLVFPLESTMSIQDNQYASLLLGFITTSMSLHEKNQRSFILPSKILDQGSELLCHSTTTIPRNKIHRDWLSGLGSESPSTFCKFATQHHGSLTGCSTRSLTTLSMGVIKPKRGFGPNYREDLSPLVDAFCAFLLACKFS